MARIRTVKPDFFRHEGLYEAEIKSGLPLRIAFAGLWTAADREGRFVWAPRQLKLDCLPYDELNFSDVLDALHECGQIIKYEVDGKTYGSIPSWHKHQHINQREAHSSLPSPSDESTCTHVNARGEGKGKERKGKEGDKTTIASAMRREPFDEFWKSYPKRDGANPKAPARKAFFAAVKAGIDAEAIIAGAKACAMADAAKIGTPYIPQAVKWLRDQRWQDYPTGPPTKVFVPPEGMPTAEELKEKYAQRRKNEGSAAESTSVLEGGLGVHPDKPNGMDLGSAEHRPVRRLGEVFRVEGLGAVCDSGDPAEKDNWNGDAD